MLRKLQLVTGCEMENRMSHHHIKGEWKSDEVAVWQAARGRTVPNMGMGRTMSGIPPSELAIFAKAAGEGDPKHVVFAAFGSAQHTLLRNTHINWYRPTYTQNGGRNENFPEPDFSYGLHGSGAHAA